MSAAPPEVAVDSFEPRFDDGYVMMEQLGKGSFGLVFAAKCRETGWRGAVKVLETAGRAQGAKKSSAEDFNTRERTARREVKMWQTVSGHPNIVELRQSFSDRQTGCWFMVMERCGCTVAEHLQRVPHKLKDMPWLLRQMLMGVAACHQAEIVHRDIKAENFLMAAGDSAVKLCDFGLAARVRARGLRGESGTAPMMSPEMLAGEPYGMGTDVWSFGAMSYLFFFWELPYVPEHFNPKSAKAAIRAGVRRPRWLSSTSLGDPVAVDFLRPLLQRDPNVRMTSSEALEHAFLQDDRTCRSGCSATGNRNSLASTTASCDVVLCKESRETLTPATDGRPWDCTAETPQTP